MKFRFAFTLIAILTAACDRRTPVEEEPPIVVPPKVVNEDDDDDGDDLEEPGEKPSVVSGISATSRQTGIHLQWPPSTGADNYAVYRMVPDWDFEFYLVGTVTVPAFVDADVYLGVTYEYYVVALNAWGSTSSGIFAYTYDASYYQPAPPGYPFIVSGGDQGSTTTTSFATEVTGITGCYQYGMMPLSVRPAEGMPLEATLQTFAVQIVYNLVQPTIYDIELHDYEGWYEMLHAELVQLPAGCGQTEVRFTVDLRYAGRQKVVLAAYGDVLHRWYYPYAPGAVTFVTSSPLPGAMLSGGVLSATFAYADLPTGLLQAVLNAEDMYDSVRLGSSSSVISGTGTVDLEIPYSLVCGYADARLNIYFDGGATEYEIRRSYALGATVSATPSLGASLIRIDTYSSQSIRVPIHLIGCPAAPMAVTVAAGLGAIALRGWEAAGASVTGTTASEFELYFTEEFIASLPFGPYQTEVTVTVGTTEYMLPFTLDVYGYFFDNFPPENAVIGEPYSITVTGVNVPQEPISFELSDSTGNYTYTYFLTWNGAAHAGEISFPYCGSYGFRLGGSYVDVYSNVAEGGPLFFHDDRLFFSFQPGEESLTSAIFINDTCYRQFTWQIVKAPSWVLFDTLIGSDWYVGAAAFRSAIPFGSPDEFGNIEVRDVIVLQADTGETLVVPVVAIVTD